MTEAEWMACTDPQKMVEFLRGKASDRKLRLLLCSWARLRWVGLSKQTRSAVVAAERFADGIASDADRKSADAELWLFTMRKRDAKKDWLARLELSESIDLWRAAHEFANANAKVNESRIAILHEIFGNPFRPLPLLSSVIIDWNDSTARRIAQAIYDERAFDHMPILADALEEAGCTDADILNHYRQPGDHVRGCWVVDLLLNKS